MSDLAQLYDAETERIDEINENLKIIQKINGLVFGTDAYLLSAYSRGKRTDTVCDLGSGTGVAALLLLSKGKAERVFAYEVQSDFADLIKRNAALNSFEGRLCVLNKDVREARPSDICGECDAVISNPPYMKTDSGRRNEHDIKYIARHEVLGDIYDFTAAAQRLLKFGGSFYCVYRPDRLVDLVSAMRSCSLEPKLMTFVHSDANSEPSMVLVEAKKGAKCGLTVTKPLVIYADGGEGSVGAREMSADACRIYDTCSFAHMIRK